jgi:hypothetical protein
MWTVKLLRCKLSVDVKTNINIEFSVFLISLCIIKLSWCWVRLILPVGGPANSSLRVVRCRFNKKSYLQEFLEMCILFFFSVRCYDLVENIHI